MVKCSHHEAGCAWTGSIADYSQHNSTCPRRNNNSDSRKRPRSDSDQSLIDSLSKKVEKLKDDLSTTKQAFHVAVEFGAAVTIERDELRNMVEIPNTNSNGGFNYDRTSVVKLTQLICQNLENKPSSINANKIFECVRNIYMDLKRGYNDNPEHYYMDVRMLFGVCLASTWFTPNQLRNLESLASEQGWLGP